MWWICDFKSFPHWNASALANNPVSSDAFLSIALAIRLTPFFVSNLEERKTLIYSSPAKPLPAKKPPEVGITAYDPDAEKKSYDIKDSR